MAKAAKNQSGLMLFSVAALLAILGQALVWRPDSEWGRQLASKGDFPLWLGWICFALGAFFLWRSWAGSGGEIAALQGPRQAPRWLEISGFALVMALALGLRLWGLHDYPNAGFRDEGENGNVAIQMMNGEIIDGTNQKLPVYIEHNTQNATGYFYPTALFFKIFGISIESERFVSVFFGVLSVAAFYFFARWLFGVPLGLFLGAALACLRWHLNFSRVGFLGIMTLSFELPLFYLLLRGLKQPAGKALQKLKGAPLAVAVALAVARGLLSFMPSLDREAFLGITVEEIVGLAMGAPLLWQAWRCRKDPRARSLMLAAAVLALAMYSYIAARLLVVIVFAVVLRHVLSQDGGIGAGPRLKLWLLSGLAILGLAVLVGGSAHAAPGIQALGKAILGLAALGLLAVFFGLRLRFVEWLKPMGLALGIGLVVAGPLYSYSLSHFTEISARSDRVSIYNDREYDKRPWGAKLLEEVPLTLGMYNVRGDGNPRHNLPGEIMLNPLWAACFGLAMFYMLFRIKDERSWLAFTWWQASLLAGYLSIEAPQAYRTIGAIPAVLIGIGLVLERGLVSLRRAWGKDGVVAGMGMLVFLLCIGAFYEVKTYFVDQPRHPGVWAEFSASEYLMGKELKELQKGGPTHGLVKADWADSYTFRFMTYPERNYEYFDMARHVPLRDFSGGTNQRYLYVLGDSYLPLVSILQDLYPKGVYHEERHPLTNERLYWSYLITAADAQSGASVKGGLKGVYYQDVASDPNKPELGPHWVKSLKRREQVDPFLLFDWTVSPVPGFFSAEWTGKIHADKAGSYEFWLSSNSYGSLEIDGRKVCERPFMPPGAPEAQGKISLSPGWHAIRVRYYEARNYSRLELWWQKPGGLRAVVPILALKPD
jgi:hypothetical protein